MKFLSNILENILQKLSENILKNPNLKKKWEKNSAVKLEFLELPPRIVVAPFSLNHKALINVDGSDRPLYFRLISEQHNSLSQH